MQRHEECGARANFGVDPDSPAMEVHDVLRDCKTQTDAGSVGERARPSFLERSE